MLVGGTEHETTHLGSSRTIDGEKSTMSSPDCGEPSIQKLAKDRRECWAGMLQDNNSVR